MVVRLRLRRRGRIAGLARLVLLFSAPVSLVRAALVWQTETAEADGVVGQYTSLALDASGLPHISYYDVTNGDLKYAVLTGAGWQIETVDSAGDVGWYTSLAIDTNGQPHISYYDGSNANLKYVSFDGSAWQIETVDDSVGIEGYETSLALDADDQPHISYLDYTSQDLKYTHFDGSAWQIQTVDSAGRVGRYTSLALGADGQPHISYYDLINAALKYTHFDGSTWQSETVDSAGDVGYLSSLALDGNDQPHISYFDLTNGDLKYAHLTLNQPPTVDAGGPYTGTEGNPVSLDATVSNPENDDLTTAWSYTINSADPGTTCAFGDAGVVDTTFTCTNDGSFTLALEANDGLNPPVTDTATVTITNVAPATTLGADTTINQGDTYTDTGSFSDPGSNDTHTATVDYGDGAGSQPLTLNPNRTFNLSHTYLADGQYTLEVCVADDDGGQGCDQLVVEVINQSPAVEAGGPYTGDEGNPISLDGAVSDPESDALTTAWSYTIDSADTGTSCSFGDASMVDTAFTCDDDGSFILTLTADDGTNPPVSDSASVTISNLAPTITEITDEVAGSQATVTVDAVDPGANDVLSYAFDCDNDDTYEIGPQAENTATCALDAQQEGSFQINVQVSDDNGGIATDSVTVTVIIPANLCANDYTGVLRYAESCRDYERAITIPDDDGPVTICASTHNGLLRSPSNGVCAEHEVIYVLPEDGPLNVCVNTYTQVMRVVDELSQCQPHELRRVLAATEVGETPSPRPS